jgi:hypothetical protein
MNAPALRKPALQGLDLPLIITVMPVRLLLALSRLLLILSMIVKCPPYPIGVLSKLRRMNIGRICNMFPMYLLGRV